MVVFLFFFVLCNEDLKIYSLRGIVVLYYYFFFFFSFLLQLSILVGCVARCFLSWEEFATVFMVPEAYMYDRETRIQRCLRSSLFHIHTLNQTRLHDAVDGVGASRSEGRSGSKQREKRSTRIDTEDSSCIIHGMDRRPACNPRWLAVFFLPL